MSIYSIAVEEKLVDRWYALKGAMDGRENALAISLRQKKAQDGRIVLLMTLTTSSSTGELVVQGFQIPAQEELPNGKAEYYVLAREFFMILSGLKDLSGEKKFLFDDDKKQMVVSVGTAKMTAALLISQPYKQSKLSSVMKVVVNAEELRKALRAVRGYAGSTPISFVYVGENLMLYAQKPGGAVLTQAMVNVKKAQASGELEKYVVDGKGECVDGNYFGVVIPASATMKMCDPALLGECEKDICIGFAREKVVVQSSFGWMELLPQATTSVNAASQFHVNILAMAERAEKNIFSYVLIDPTMFTQCLRTMSAAAAIYKAKNSVSPYMYMNVAAPVDGEQEYRMVLSMIDGAQISMKLLNCNAAKAFKECAFDLEVLTNAVSQIGSTDALIAAISDMGDGAQMTLAGMMTVEGKLQNDPSLTVYFCSISYGAAESEKTSPRTASEKKEK